MPYLWDRSTQLYSRAFKVTGTQRADLDNLFPVVFTRGRGCRVYDLDDNEYIDFTGASGAVNLGYSYEPVDHAVADYLRERGNVFITKISEPRVELAEKLISIVPCSEYVSFHKTGSCATSVAVRLAKIASGGDIVLSAGYHGWHDWQLNMFDQFKIPDQHHINFEYSLDKLEELLAQYGKRVSCVIITPEPHFFPLDYFVELEKIIRSAGIILIFDEVASGFRYELGGFQKYCGVKPDLSVFGKGLANGYAIAAVVGRKDLIMTASTKAHTWSTFDAEVGPMIASLATIEEFQSKNVLSHMSRVGNQMRDGVGRLCSELGVVHKITQFPAVFHIIFDDDVLYDSWILECLKRGVVLSRFDYQLISFSHQTADIDSALEILRASLLACQDKFPNSFGHSNREINSDTMERRTRHEFGGTLAYRKSRK